MLGLVEPVIELVVSVVHDPSTGLGIQTREYDLLPDQDWMVDLGHMESLIDHNTAAIIVNSPSNPCGSVFSPQHLLEILDIAERHKVPIIGEPKNHLDFPESSLIDCFSMRQPTRSTTTLCSLERPTCQLPPSPPRWPSSPSLRKLIFSQGACSVLWRPDQEVPCARLANGLDRHL